MELRDLIVTPLVILFVCTVAYFIRPFCSDQITKKYFFPALLLRIFGAIALGFIYQFYYDGGDTFNYHTRGSRVVWEALTDDFSIGLKILFSNGEIIRGGYKYISRIPFYFDQPSFAVVRVSTVFDLITFSSYTATAVFFSILSFSGAWLLFVTFYRKCKRLHFPIAVATLFIPSVIFWGSGILKDTIVLAALGVSVYCVDQLLIQKNLKTGTIVMIIMAFITIYSIRKFVLQAFIPSAFLWVYYKNLTSLRSSVLKILITPMVVISFIFSAYYSVIKVGEGDNRYSADNLAKTAQVTAQDISALTGRNAGSTYILGDLDGSLSSTLLLAPKAINVSLFRPYLWEVRNPLMLLSALEGIFFLLLTVAIIVRGKFFVLKSFSDPNIIFCFVLSISFAFAVGVSTFNFGTLARYKIPLLPFYLLGLIFMYDQIRQKTSNNDLAKRI